MNKKNNEANTWTKKYLIADSVDREFLLSIINGINDNKLISNPIHIPNHEEDEKVMKDPHIIVKKKIILAEKLIIKKKRIKIFIIGVWTQ